MDLPFKTLEFGEAQRVRWTWFAEYYEHIVVGILLPNQGNRYLGDKADRHCRYCLRCKPEVKFKKKAHAFPELIGNKTLIDYSECDTCNKHFADNIEDDFSKFTMPWRTFGRVDGKNGIPSHKSLDGQFRIDSTDATQLQVQMRRGDIRASEDKPVRP